MQYKNINPMELNENVIRLISLEWMLITAGDESGYNTMTASWGGLGFMWNRPVALCVVRPVRHTYGFIEKHGAFTLSFYDEKYKKALQLCGSKSGRDIDKAKEAGLTPVFESGSVYFSEARLVLICKKLYYNDINPGNFIDKKINENYPNQDYHRVYVGEISQCLISR